MLEDRRRRALRLLDAAFDLYQFAAKIGCVPSPMPRWRDARSWGVEQALQVKATPRRPLKLTPRQPLLRQFLRGPAAHGYSADMWTTERIAEMMGRRFRVFCHRDHVGRLMLVPGWSCQAPQRRALERDEDRIWRWRVEDRSRSKKTTRGRTPTSPLSMRQGSK